MEEDVVIEYLHYLRSIGPAHGCSENLIRLSIDNELHNCSLLSSVKKVNEFLEI